MGLATISRAAVNNSYAFSSLLLGVDLNYGADPGIIIIRVVLIHMNIFLPLLSYESHCALMRIARKTLKRVELCLLSVGRFLTFESLGKQNTDSSSKEAYDIVGSENEDKVSDKMEKVELPVTGRASVVPEKRSTTANARLFIVENYAQVDLFIRFKEMQYLDIPLRVVEMSQVFSLCASFRMHGCNIFCCTLYATYNPGVSAESVTMLLTSGMAVERLVQNNFTTATLLVRPVF